MVGVVWVALACAAVGLSAVQAVSLSAAATSLQMANFVQSNSTTRTYVAWRRYTADLEGADLSTLQTNTPGIFAVNKADIMIEIDTGSGYGAPTDYASYAAPLGETASGGTNSVSDPNIFVWVLPTPILTANADVACLTPYVSIAGQCYTVGKPTIITGLVQSASTSPAHNIVKYRLSGAAFASSLEVTVASFSTTPATFSDNNNGYHLIRKTSASHTLLGSETDATVYTHINLLTDVVTTGVAVGTAINAGVEPVVAFASDPSSVWAVIIMDPVQAVVSSVTFNTAPALSYVFVQTTLSDLTFATAQNGAVLKLTPTSPISDGNVAYFNSIGSTAATTVTVSGSAFTSVNWDITTESAITFTRRVPLPFAVSYTFSVASGNSYLPLYVAFVQTPTQDVGIQLGAISSVADYAEGTVTLSVSTAGNAVQVVPQDITVELTFSTDVSSASSVFYTETTTASRVVNVVVPRGIASSPSLTFHPFNHMNTPNLVGKVTAAIVDTGYANTYTIASPTSRTYTVTQVYNSATVLRIAQTDAICDALTGDGITFTCDTSAQYIAANGWTYATQSSVTEFQFVGAWSSGGQALALSSYPHTAVNKIVAGSGDVATKSIPFTGTLTGGLTHVSIAATLINLAATSTSACTGANAVTFAAATLQNSQITIACTANSALTFAGIFAADGQMTGTSYIDISASSYTGTGAFTMPVLSGYHNNGTHVRIVAGAVPSSVVYSPGAATQLILTNDAHTEFLAFAKAASGDAFGQAYISVMARRRALAGNQQQQLTQYLTATDTYAYLTNNAKPTVSIGIQNGGPESVVPSVSPSFFGVVQYNYTMQVYSSAPLLDIYIDFTVVGAGGLYSVSGSPPADTLMSMGHTISIPLSANGSAVNAYSSYADRAAVCQSMCQSAGYPVTHASFQCYCATANPYFAFPVNFNAPAQRVLSDYAYTVTLESSVAYTLGQAVAAVNLPISPLPTLSVSVINGVLTFPDITSDLNAPQVSQYSTIVLTSNIVTAYTQYACTNVTGNMTATIDIAAGSTEFNSCDWLLIPPGQTSEQTVLTLFHERILEVTEVLSVVLAPANHYHVGSPSTAMVIVTNANVPRLGWNTAASGAAGVSGSTLQTSASIVLPIVQKDANVTGPMLVPVTLTVFASSNEVWSDLSASYAVPFAANQSSSLAVAFSTNAMYYDLSNAGITFTIQPHAGAALVPSAVLATTVSNPSAIPNPAPVCSPNANALVWSGGQLKTKVAASFNKLRDCWANSIGEAVAGAVAINPSGTMNVELATTDLDLTFTMNAAGFTLNLAGRGSLTSLNGTLTLQAGTVVVTGLTLTSVTGGALFVVSGSSSLTLAGCTLRYDSGAASPSALITATGLATVALTGASVYSTHVADSPALIAVTSCTGCTLQSSGTYTHTYTGSSASTVAPPVVAQITDGSDLTMTTFSATLTFSHAGVANSVFDECIGSSTFGGGSNFVALARAGAAYSGTVSMASGGVQYKTGAAVVAVRLAQMVGYSAGSVRLTYACSVSDRRNVQAVAALIGLADPTNSPMILDSESTYRAPMLFAPDLSGWLDLTSVSNQIVHIRMGTSGSSAGGGSEVGMNKALKATSITVFSVSGSLVYRVSVAMTVNTLTVAKAVAGINKPFVLSGAATVAIADLAVERGSNVVRDVFDGAAAAAGSSVVVTALTIANEASAASDLLTLVAFGTAAAAKSSVVARLSLLHTGFMHLSFPLSTSASDTSAAPGITLDELAAALGLASAASDNVALMSTGSGPYTWYGASLTSGVVAYALSTSTAGNTAHYPHALALAMGSLRREVQFCTSGTYTDTINLRYGLLYTALSGAVHTGAIQADSMYAPTASETKAWVSAGYSKSDLATLQGTALATLMGRSVTAASCGSVGRTVDVPSSACLGTDLLTAAAASTSIFPDYVTLNSWTWDIASGSALVNTGTGRFSPIPFLSGLKNWQWTTSAGLTVSGNPPDAANNNKAAAVFIVGTSAITVTGVPFTHNSHTVSLYVKGTTVTSSTSSCSNYIADVTANTGTDSAQSRARLDLAGVTISGSWCSSGGMARYTASVPSSNADYGLPLFKYSASMLSRAISDSIPIVKSTSSAISADQRQVLGAIQANWVSHPAWFAYGYPGQSSSGAVLYYAVTDASTGADGRFTWPNTYASYSDVSVPLALNEPWVQPAVAAADTWMTNVARTSGRVVLGSGNSAIFYAVSGGDNTVANVHINSLGAMHFNSQSGTQFTLTGAVINGGTITRGNATTGGNVTISVQITSSSINTIAHAGYAWLLGYTAVLTSVSPGDAVPAGRTLTVTGTNLQDLSTQSDATTTAVLSVTPASGGAAIAWAPTRINRLSLSVGNTASVTMNAAGITGTITDFAVQVSSGSTFTISGFSGSLQLPASGYMFQGPGRVKLSGGALAFVAPARRRSLLANTDCLYEPGSSATIDGANVTTDKCLGDFVSFTCSGGSVLTYTASALDDAFVKADTVSSTLCTYVDGGRISGANRIGRGLLWGDGGATFAAANNTLDVSAVTHNNADTGSKVMKAYAASAITAELNEFVVRGAFQTVTTFSGSASLWLDLSLFNGAGSVVVRNNRISTACLNRIPPLAEERLNPSAGRCAPYNGIVLDFDSQNDVTALVSFASAYGIDYVCATNREVRILNLANPKLVGTYIDVQSDDTVPVSSSNAGGASVCSGSSTGSGTTIQTAVGFASDAYVSPATFNGNLNLTVWMNATDPNAIFFVGLTPYNTSRSLGQNANATICNNYYGTNLAGFDPTNSPDDAWFKALYSPRYVRALGVLHAFGNVNMTSHEFNVSLLTMDGFEGCGDLTTTPGIENGKLTYTTTFTVYAYALQNVVTLNTLAIGHQSSWAVTVRLDSEQNVLSVSIVSSTVSTLYTTPTVQTSTNPATLGLFTFSFYTMNPDIAGTDVTLRNALLYTGRSNSLPLCTGVNTPRIAACRYNCTLAETSPSNAASAVPSISQSHTAFSIQFWQATCYNTGAHYLDESFSFIATPYYGGQNGAALVDSLFTATFHLYDTALNIQMGGVIDMATVAASIEIGLQTEAAVVASQGAWAPVSPSSGVYSAFLPTDRIAVQMRYDNSIPRAAYTDTTGYNSVQHYRPTGVVNLDVTSLKLCTPTQIGANPTLTPCTNGAQACSCGTYGADLTIVPVSASACATSSNPHTATCYEHKCVGGHCDTGPNHGAVCYAHTDCQLAGYAGTCRHGTQSGSPCNTNGDCPVSHDHSMCNQQYSDEQKNYVLSPAGRRYDAATVIGYLGSTPTVPCTAVPYAQYLNGYVAGTCVLSKGTVTLGNTTYSNLNGYANDFGGAGFVGPARACLAQNSAYRTCKLASEAGVTAWSGASLWNAGASPCAGGEEYCRHEGDMVITSFRVPPAFRNRAVTMDISGHVAPMPANMHYVTTGLFPAPSADEGTVTVTALLTFNSSAPSVPLSSYLLTVSAPASAPAAVSSGTGLSSGGIVGIVLGVVGFVCIVAAVIFLVKRHHAQALTKTHAVRSSLPTTERRRRSRRGTSVSDPLLDNTSSIFA